MSEKQISLEIVNPEKIVYTAEMYSLVVPGANGLLGILPDHAPLVTRLDVGEIDMKDSKGNIVKAFIGGGFMEVMNNKAVVLATVAEMAGDIDVERAKKAKQRAEERLAHRGEGEVDVARAEYALRKALARIHTVS